MAPSSDDVDRLVLAFDEATGGGVRALIVTSGTTESLEETSVAAVACVWVLAAWRELRHGPGRLTGS